MPNKSERTMKLKTTDDISDTQTVTGRNNGKTQIQIK